MAATTELKTTAMKIVVVVVFVVGLIGASPINSVIAETEPDFPSADKPLYISLLANQTVSGIATAKQDILRFDGATWSLYFDGSDVGLGKVNLVDFIIPYPDTILFSINTSITINGLTITPQDIINFTASALGANTSGTLSLYFDGSDAGLETTAEKIDAFSLLPDGRLLISTSGNPSVTGVTGARDEDILAFTPSALGDFTSGVWQLYFDGSDVGLGEAAGEDIDGIEVSGGTIYLSTVDLFSVNGLSGTDEDIFICQAISLGNTTSCNYLPSLYFQGSTWGMSANDIDGIGFLTIQVVPTPTPTSPPAPGSGVAGHWKFDEISWAGDCLTADILDSSGNDRHGIACINGDSPFPVPGKFGNAGHFDGINQYANMGPGFNFTSSFTAAVWLALDDYQSCGPTGKSQHIIGTHHLATPTGNGRGWGIYWDCSGLAWELTNSTGSAIVSYGYIEPSPFPENGTWHHAALVYDSTVPSATLYWDGVPVYSENGLENVPSLLFNNGEPLTVNGLPYAPSSGAPGSIDDTRVYNRALSPEEITALYEGF